MVRSSAKEEVSTVTGKLHRKMTNSQQKLGVFEKSNTEMLPKKDGKRNSKVEIQRGTKKKNKDKKINNDAIEVLTT